MRRRWLTPVTVENLCAAQCRNPPHTTEPAGHEGQPGLIEKADSHVEAELDRVPEQSNLRIAGRTALTMSARTCSCH